MNQRVLPKMLISRKRVGALVRLFSSVASACFSFPRARKWSVHQRTVFQLEISNIGF